MLFYTQNYKYYSNLRQFVFIGLIAVNVTEMHTVDGRTSARQAEKSILNKVNLPSRVRQKGKQKGFGQTVIGTASGRILRPRKGLKELSEELKKMAKEKKANKKAKK